MPTAPPHRLIAPLALKERSPTTHSALRLMDISFHPLVQPLAMPPFDILACVPTARRWCQDAVCPALGFPPAHRPLHSLRLFMQLRQPTRGGGAGAGLQRLARSSCQALICMQKGLGGIYHGLALGSCSRPRKTLRRRRAVGKIRTGPSAAAHALVTLQAANIEIIFIYNLFDHPASKRARLV